MGLKSMSSKLYAALLIEAQSINEADAGFIRRLLRAVNSGGSELQSETLLNAVNGRRIKTPKGTLTGLQQTYSVQYSGYIYAPIYIKEG